MKPEQTNSSPSFRIAGRACGRVIEFSFTAGHLDSADTVAVRAASEAIVSSDLIQVRPHIVLKPSLTDRAFVQMFLVMRFFDTVECLDESPSLIFPDDVT